MCMKVNNLNLTFYKLKLTPYILIFFFFFFSFSVLQILAVDNPGKFAIKDRENRTDLTVQHDHVVLGFTNGYKLELLVFLKHFWVSFLLIGYFWLKLKPFQMVCKLCRRINNLKFLFLIFLGICLN